MSDFIHVQLKDAYDCNNEVNRASELITFLEKPSVHL